MLRSTVLQQPTVVPLLQLDELLFHHLQLHGQLVQGFQAVGLRFLILQFGQSGMNLHQGQGDGFAGFLDLFDSGGAVHEAP